MIRDDDLGQAEFALDARICLNVKTWRLEMGGQMVYIARLDGQTYNWNRKDLRDKLQI